MQEYKVIIHHLDGTEEHTSLMGYSADHVMDELNVEYKNCCFSVIPPLPTHTDIIVKAVKGELTKSFTLDDLGISSNDYTDRRDLYQIVQASLTNYDHVELVN